MIEGDASEACAEIVPWKGRRKLETRVMVRR